ncbi:MAG: hypothetical protein ISS52_00560 [Dehalococcoidia bacterium]|nr:hypothetical protein [Dehalococcoidia bacterium]
MVEAVGPIGAVRENPNVVKLGEGILAGNIEEIKPTLDLGTELGFTFPQVENLLGVTTGESITILESLASEDALEKQFYDRILFCPYCSSPNLRPSLRCPKCGSANIAKGRVLEHFSCSNVGLEDEYVAAGKYVCPKCNKELRFLGTDYLSLGVNYKCHNCGELSSEAALEWQCLKCMLFFAEGEAKETILYSYRVDAEKRPWLGFELGPKARFIEFLRGQGYEVTEKGKVGSRNKSGTEHVLDILARRDDGFITYTLGIGIVVDSQGQEIGLEEVFTFDDKAYDLGIHDKVLLVVPRLNREARQFAERQQIKVFEGDDLEAFLASATPSAPREMKKESFKFETRGKLLEYLRSLGYSVEEKAQVRGRSGAERILDILACSDDGIIIHTVDIGVVVADEAVGLEAVSSFDTKAYDAGMHDKVLLVSPGLNQEATQFARHQGIKVIEVDDPARLM